MGGIAWGAVLANSRWILRYQAPLTGTIDTIARKFHLISFQLNTIKFLCATIKLAFVVVVVAFAGQSEQCFVVIDFPPRPSRSRPEIQEIREI